MTRNVNKEHKESLSVLDKAALFITAIVGTMWCAIAFTILALISLPQALHGGTATDYLLDCPNLFATSIAVYHYGGAKSAKQAF